MKVLFVCTGNTCRSPMAALLAEKIGQEKGMNVRCDSAGIYASCGDAASREAVEVMKTKYGLDLSHHRSKPLTAYLLDEADLVIGITENHALLMGQRFGKKEKIFAMPEDVGDPFGSDTAVYTKCAEKMEKGILTLMERGILHD